MFRRDARFRLTNRRLFKPTSPLSLSLSLSSSLCGKTETSRSRKTLLPPCLSTMSRISRAPRSTMTSKIRQEPAGNKGRRGSILASCRSHVDQRLSINSIFRIFRRIRNARLATTRSQIQLYLAEDVIRDTKTCRRGDGVKIKMKSIP